MSDKQMILPTFNASYLLIRLAECLIRLSYDTLIENAKVDINSSRCYLLSQTSSHRYGIHILSNAYLLKYM